MLRQLFGTGLLLSILGLLIYTVLSSSPAQASLKDLNVVTKTTGHEELKAAIDGQLKINLKNNHAETITAFAINFGDVTIKEDFVYSDVDFGIKPGDTFQKDYPVSSSPIGSEPPTVYLLTVLLKDGSNEGDAKEAQKIRDERLGEKIQILRALKILEKEDQSRKDLKTTKSEIVAAFDSSEAETRTILNELEPRRMNNKLSDALMSGLQVGREKMLRRFEVIEQLPPQYREEGFKELKARSNKLFAKL